MLTTQRLMTAAKPNVHPSGIRVRTYRTSEQASLAIATEIASLIRKRRAAGRHCILGLATGSTPLRVYSELVRMHRQESLSFINVVSFNLDEYFPISRESRQSYFRFMQENLFDHIDILPENVNVPDGTVSAAKVQAHCHAYEKRIAEAGGIDLQILGIGRSGHIGFNEPGSDRGSRTRLVQLNAMTRSDAANDFSGIANVPTQAITMGVDTILSARRVRLLAFGERKARIVQRALQTSVSKQLPASFLQNHGDVEFIVDASCAGE